MGYTKTEIKLANQLHKLKQKRETLLDHPELKAYLVFLGRSQAKVNMEIQAWDDYYKEVQVKRYGYLAKMKKALASRDKQEFSRLQREMSSDLKKLIKEPNYPDPREMQKSGIHLSLQNQLKAVDREILDITEKLNEYRETKETQNILNTFTNPNQDLTTVF